MARLVLTGFRAFPGVADNPTQALVEYFRSAPHELEQPHRLELLDVDYRTVGSAIDALLDLAPEAMLLTGYSNLASRVTLEACATGLCAADKPDVCGHVPEPGPNQPALLTTGLDLNSLHARLEQGGIAAEISQDAGQYLCNFSYRHALSQVADRGLSTRVLFLHLPALEGTDLARGAAGTISFAQARRALALVAAEMLKNES